MEEIESTQTFPLSYCMASLNTPVMTRNHITIISYYIILLLLLLYPFH